MSAVPDSVFEAAVDAIINGDLGTLKTFLSDHPALVRERSTRGHHSVLLHYVAANGVEDVRQKTPHNIVEITELLLDAGADVHAESDAYGGRSTTLGLAATSCHPEKAGLQLPLMELLIQHGAPIENPDGSSLVNDCLRNGRGQAAEFLANRGAKLDLEAAAGVGRLEVVKSFFAKDGNLKPSATSQQMEDGFAWACEFGRTGIVDFLLQHGMDVQAKLKHHGQTGLHWAALGGHIDTLRLLLQHGAPLNPNDEHYGGTPLDWARYASENPAKRADRSRYEEAIVLLVQADAKRWETRRE